MLPGLSQLGTSDSELRAAHARQRREFLAPDSGSFGLQLQKSKCGQSPGAGSADLINYAGIPISESVGWIGRPSSSVARNSKACVCSSGRRPAAVTKQRVAWQRHLLSLIPRVRASAQAQNQMPAVAGAASRPTRCGWRRLIRGPPTAQRELINARIRRGHWPAQRACGGRVGAARHFGDGLALRRRRGSPSDTVAAMVLHSRAPAARLSAEWAAPAPLKLTWI